MSGRLSHHLNSDFIAAANRLNGRHARRKIVAYVEGYEDVFFWSQLLRPLETEHYYFEVMLPSRATLSKGKKVALANLLGPRLGECMIACVDADYDYLMQGATEMSQQVCRNPYVFHTYVYAIENYRCYAPALAGVCVMATLNDRQLFDFEDFLTRYSEAIWPLFTWNVWAYRYGRHTQFSMADFYRTVAIDHLDYQHPERTLEAVRRRANVRLNHLYHQFPEGRTTYKPVVDDLQRLGVTPQTTYLYMRGHDLFDGIVVPLLTDVCDALRHEREVDIQRLAGHDTQRQNELSAYRHAVVSIEEMLRRHTGYVDAPTYQRIREEVRAMITRLETGEAGTEEEKRADKEGGSGVGKEEERGK
jgi:hypothetical protein